MRNLALINFEKICEFADLLEELVDVESNNILI